MDVIQTHGIIFIQPPILVFVRHFLLLGHLWIGSSIEGQVRAAGPLLRLNVPDKAGAPEDPHDSRIAP
jgi:hypothetical protein